MWHASLSLWTPARVKLRAPGRLERAAVRLLTGVGGDTEWWIWNPTKLVAHLRVAVTPAEHQHIPAGQVVADAGDSGPRRPRTQPRR